MISADSAKSLHAMLSQTIDSMSLLMVPSDPAHSVLSQSKSAMTSMIELIKQLQSHNTTQSNLIVGLTQQKVAQAKTIADLEKKVEELEKAAELPVKADLTSKWMEVAKTWQSKASERKKEINSLKEQLASADSSAAYNGQKKVEHFQEWKNTQAELEACQAKLDLAQKNFLASDHDYQKFYAEHVKTLAQKDAQIKFLESSPAKPGIGWVEESKFIDMTQKYNTTLLFFTQAMDAKKQWAEEAQKFKQKYQMLVKRMVMVESITAEMRSLVVDAIAWGEKRQAEIFNIDTWGVDNYQFVHVDKGHKWYFRSSVQREVMKWIVERNDAIRDKWDEKVKELANV